jgi:hypothetical protein
VEVVAECAKVCLFFAGVAEGTEPESLGLRPPRQLSDEIEKGSIDLKYP